MNQSNRKSPSRLRKASERFVMTFLATIVMLAFAPSAQAQNGQSKIAQSNVVVAPLTELEKQGILAATNDPKATERYIQAQVVEHRPVEAKDNGQRNIFILTAFICLILLGLAVGIKDPSGIA